MGKDDWLGGWLAGWLDERKKRRSGQVWVGLLTPLTHSAGTARAPQVTWFIFLSRSPPFRAMETETRRGGNGPPILQRHGQRTSGRLTLRFPQVSPKLYTSLRSHFPGTGTRSVPTLSLELGIQQQLGRQGPGAHRVCVLKFTTIREQRALSAVGRGPTDWPFRGGDIQADPRRTRRHHCQMLGKSTSGRGDSRCQDPERGRLPGRGQR